MFKPEANTDLFRQIILAEGKQSGSVQSIQMSQGRAPVLTAAKPHSLPASAQLFTVALPAAAPHVARPPARVAIDINTIITYACSSH